MQGEFSESLTEKQFQNEGEKTSIGTIGPEKPLLVADHETKDKSKSSGVDTPTNDGSIFVIPESKEGKMALKVNTGGSTIDTPQKDAGVKKTPQTQKSQEVLVRKD